MDNSNVDGDINSKIIKWLNRNFELNIDPKCNDEKELITYLIKAIQIYLNTQYKSDLLVSGVYDSATYLSVYKHMTVKSYNTNENNIIYYFIRIALNLRGFPCELNSSLDFDLKNALHNFKQEYNKRKYVFKYIFTLDSNLWYIILNNKNFEEEK